MVIKNNILSTSNSLTTVVKMGLKTVTFELSLKNKDLFTIIQYLRERLSLIRNPNLTKY